MIFFLVDSSSASIPDTAVRLTRAGEELLTALNANRFVNSDTVLEARFWAARSIKPVYTLSETKYR